jgi:xeroderma pigmentosum group C-complementing protein
MARAKGTTKTGRPKAKDETTARPKVPDVYKEMLADAVSSASQTNEEGKVIKRRRVAGRVITHDPGQPLIGKPIYDSETPDDKEHVKVAQNHEPAAQQTAYHESEDSAESDLEWEEVNFGEGPTPDASSRHLDNQNGELSLVLTEDHRGSRGQARVRKAPVTAAERQLRLETHKMHLLSLLVHIFLRNYWCNWEDVHVRLLYCTR